MLYVQIVQIISQVRHCGTGTLHYPARGHDSTVWRLGAQIKEAGNAPADGVMVCGDSGNDVELFAVPGVRGCMVVNAHPELRDWCQAHASPQIFQVWYSPSRQPVAPLE